MKSIIVVTLHLLSFLVDIFCDPVHKCKTLNHFFLSDFSVVEEYFTTIYFVEMGKIPSTKIRHKTILINQTILTQLKHVLLSIIDITQVTFYPPIGQGRCLNVR